MERSLTKKGRVNIKTMGSYLKLHEIKPDLILSSCSLRAQETSDGLAEIIEYEDRIHYLQELYMTPTTMIKETLMLQSSDNNSIFIIGHNPQITDFTNMFIDEHIAKIPTMGIVSLDFDIEDWSELEDKKGKLNFFIYPKQFKYFMPKQIRTILE